MSNNFFKIKYFPNADGSNSSTVLNDSNTVFVHTYVGDDLTGDGTRAYPYRSVGKALLKSGSYIVFRGVVNEPFTINDGGKILLGDDINQMIITSNYTNVISSIWNLTIDTIPSMSGNNYNNAKNRIIFTQLFTQSYYEPGFLYDLFKVGRFPYYNGGAGSATNCTFSIYGLPASMTNPPTNRNNIVYNTLDITVGSCYLKYNVFSTSTVFKSGGVTITSPSWTNDSKTNVSLIKAAYISQNSAWGTGSFPTRPIDSIFYVDSFGNETCKIIKEIKNGGTRPNIFNRYSGNTVLDWTLNPDINNEALFASDTGGFVGCFKPNMSVSSSGTTTWSSIKNVNTDGSDDVTGTLLLNNSDIISFANNPSVTTQIWNRMTGTTVLSLPTGVLFNGIEAMSTDGSPFGYYIGKHQELVDPVQLTTGSTLVVGNIYKVCNSVHVTANGVTYNGNNYAPDYFFRCVYGVTTFTLVTPGSGTYLQKLNSTPLESIEIIPYSDLTTVSSTYPKFSCPLSGDVKMLFYSASGASRYSKTIGTPVLFGDLKSGNFLTDYPNVCDKISYYDTWGVTNADQEFLTLVSNGYFTYSAPLIKFLKIEMNGHFNAAYDY